MSDGVPKQGSLKYPVRLDPWHQIVEANFGGDFLVEVLTHSQFDYNYITLGGHAGADLVWGDTIYPLVEGDIVEQAKSIADGGPKNATLIFVDFLDEDSYGEELVGTHTIIDYWTTPYTKPDWP